MAVDPSIEARLRADPEIAALLAQIEQMRQQGVPLGAPAGSAQQSIMSWAQQNLEPVLRRKGINLPADQLISLGSGGNPVGSIQKRNFFDRNVDWIAPSIVGAAGAIGGLGAAGAFGGGAASSAAPGAGITGAGMSGGFSTAAPGAAAAAGGGAGMTGMEIGTLLANIGAGIFGGINQQKMSKEQIAEMARQFGINLDVNQQNLEQANINEQAQQGVSGVQQTPNRVGWRQNQALTAAMLPELRNVSVSSPIPGMNAFIPQISGGVRIPEGGFGPDTMKFFGDNAMLQGEYDLDRSVQGASGGRAPVTGYTGVYGETGAPFESGLTAVQQSVQADEARRARERNAAIQRALGQMSNSGSSIRRG